MALATITALTAKPGVQQVKLSWTLDEPNAGGLSYMVAEGVQVVMSPVNDRDDSAAETIEAGLVDHVISGLPEEVQRYFWTRPRFAYNDASGTRQVYYGDWYPSDPEDGVVAAAIGMAGLAFGAANLKLVPSVASDDLTVAIKTASGDDPSADNPVYISFRDTSSATGEYYILAITGPLSLTVPQSGTNKLGTLDGRPFRLWVGIFDDDGTPHLGVINCLSAPGTGTIGDHVTIYPLANIGARSSDTVGLVAGRIFSDATITNKPFRVIGHMVWEEGLVTAGTWDEEPTYTQLVGRDTKLPGEEVFNTCLQEPTGSSFTTQIPFDGTIPQHSEGSEIYSSIQFAPSSAANVVEYFFKALVGHSVADTYVTIALRRNAETGDLSASRFAHINTADRLVLVDLVQRFLIGHYGTDETGTFRIGGSQAGNWYINRDSTINPGAVVIYGAREIMA